MALHDVCIRRPVFATMITSVLVVLGIFSYFDLGVDLMPKADIPTCVITTTLPGAGPEEIEAQVTKQIEDAVSTVSGIDELRSNSFEGLSQVVVSFVLEKNGDLAAQEVRDRVARILSQLPEGTQQPIIEKFDPDATPVLELSVFGDMNVRDLTELARRRVKEALDGVFGVGQIQIVGGRDREIHVVLDAPRMAAYNVSIQDITRTLARENVELPGGRVDRGDHELILRTLGRIMAPREFENLVITERDGASIRIRDVATVQDAEEEPRTFSSFDGRVAVSLVIRKQSGENTVAVVKRVREKLNEIRAGLPPGVKVEEVRDLSVFIEQSLHEVTIHLLLGGLLAALTVLFFMRSWRSTLIAGIAIPVSLIATFTLMRLMGFTLNNLTLMGLTLSVGIVIDDALVVLENIFRHIEEKGSPPVRAAHEATSEISLAVMATTLSLVVIFLSIGFMRGIVGRFLSSFGLTVAFAIMVSLFISFTLTPMLCSLFLKKPKAGHGSHDGRITNAIERGYLRLLHWAMAHRKTVVFFSVMVAVMTVPLLMIVSKEFVPSDDQNEFEIAILAPEGYTLERSHRLIQELEARVRTLPEVRHILCKIGAGEGSSTNSLSLYVKLSDLKERSIGQVEVMSLARRILKDYPELRSSVQEVKSMGGGGMKSQPFNLSIRGPDLVKLGDIVRRVLAAMHKRAELVDIDSSLSFGKPELRVKIDRDRAADLGVSVRDIADAMRLFVGGDLKITGYREGDEVYDVKVRARAEDRGRLAAISDLRIPSRNGMLVPLSALATLEEATGPTQIDRYNRQRQVTLYANIAPGKVLGDAVTGVEQDVKAMNLPSEYIYKFVGFAKIMADTFGSFKIAFFLSFIFMYMILASQFESFLHPITILLSLPLAIPFALVTLVMAHMSLNLYSILGLFMLFGVVKKNAILQIDYTNTLRERGMARYDAIIEANRARLRPILMTTITLVMGMVPLAMGRGAGAGARSTMGVAIIGGQALSLLITLILTPVAYSYFDDLTAWLKRRWSREAPMTSGAGSVQNAGKGETR